MRKKITTTLKRMHAQRSRRGLIRLVYMRTFLFALLTLGLLAANALGQAGTSLNVLHQVENNTIAISNGDGRPETTQVTLSLSAPTVDEVAIDLMMVIDRSATTDIEYVREIGELFLDALPSNGRIGLVSFAEEATVDVELTSSPQLFRSGLRNLRNIGKTAVGDGLFEATQHFIQRGREDAIWISLLITDGRANAGRDPRLQAQRAADNGIQIVSIGMGRNPDENLLRDVAEISGGSFFREFEFVVVDEVLSRADLTVAAKDITVVETLAPGIVFEQALVNPPTFVSVDPFLGTRLEWKIDRLRGGESWITTYTISATEEGNTTVNTSPSEVTYTDFRGARQSESLPILQLTVLPPLPPNAPAVVDFSYKPEVPNTSTDTVFTNASFDPDGEIVEYFWTFGDGNSSNLKSPSHRYVEDGTFEVTLTVTDNRGDTQRLTKTLMVETKRINIVRSIDTFLAKDMTLAGQSFMVHLDIEINTPLNGMGVTESINQNIPEDWIVNPISHGAASFKQTAAPRELQWVFLEVFTPGDQFTITYEVVIPDGELPGIFTFNGVAASASPDIEIRTTGDGQLEIQDSLSVIEVVSRWDPQGGINGTGGLDLEQSDRITFDQVQVAIGWWLNNDIVEYTGGRRIGFADIQAIIAFWLTDTPITESLPGGSEDES